MSENAKRENRIQGIVNRIASEDSFDPIKWITQAPVMTFCRSAVDETAQKNAELQRDLGIQAKIVRTMTGRENCKWCEGLAGEYEYPGVPQEVFHRHDDCDCVVEYQPGDGSVQDVWSKEWREAQEDLEFRKNYNTSKYLPDIIIPRAIGASGNNYNISLPSGKRAKLASGTKITKVLAIAGKGSNTKLRVAEKLEELYNIPAKEWSKMRGQGIIRHEGENIVVELHWYQAGSEIVLMKVKRYFE